MARDLASSDRDGGLIVWGRQAMASASEVEHYREVEEMARRASTVVVGRILGPGPERVLHGDPGTGDVLTYPSTLIEVIDSLAGTRDTRPGDVLVLEGFVAPAEEGKGTVAVLFLRDKQDDEYGVRIPGVSDSEKGLYRLVSHQGVFIDRGDGVPINPIVEVTRLLDSFEDIPLDEFIFGDNLPDPRNNPIAAEMRNTTMLDLLTLLASA